MASVYVPSVFRRQRQPKLACSCLNQLHHHRLLHRVASAVTEQWEGVVRRAAELLVQICTVSRQRMKGARHAQRAVTYAIPCSCLAQSPRISLRSRQVPGDLLCNMIHGKVAAERYLKFNLPCAEESAGHQQQFTAQWHTSRRSLPRHVEIPYVDHVDRCRLPRRTDATSDAHGSFTHGEV